MYAIVGCSECSHLWLIEGRSETTQCPRCGSRRPYEKRKKFLETEDADHAREVRASMLASRQGQSDAFAKVDSFADLDEQVGEGVIDDDTYLEGAGLDPAEVSEGGNPPSIGTTRGGNKRETIEGALEDLDEPTRQEVVEYAEERGVDAGYVDRALDKLVRRGAVSESRGRYRLL